MKNKIAKWLLIASLAFNVLFGIWGIRHYCQVRQQIKEQAKFNWADITNNQKMAVFSSLDISRDDIVFVGNSLTENFPLEELLPEFRIKNRGISGNLTSHILGRIADVVKYNPKKIFLEGGINDLIAHGSADSIFARYTAILNIIQKNRITAYVQSLLPTCMEYSNLNDAVIAFNERLKNYCNRKGFIYIDIYSELVENGKLNETLTVDGLHLNVKGYQIWKTKIFPYLR